MGGINFVGREDVVPILTEVINGNLAPSRKLTIQSIEGPGGIGKTTLLNHVIDTIDISYRNYLTLKIDGKEADEKNIAALVLRMVDSAFSEVIRGTPSGYYFNKVKDVVKATDIIITDSIDEFRKKFPDDEEGIKELEENINNAFSFGEAINDVAPITRQYVDFGEGKKHLGNLGKVLPKLKSLRCQAVRSWERLGISSAASLKNSVRRNACGELADALVHDLSAIISGYKKEQIHKPAHQKINGLDRLLIIIDDYEKVQGVLGKFFAVQLFPRLKKANFETTAIILGRDRLEVTDPAWDQDLKACLMRRIEVQAFSKSELDKLIDSCGIKSACDKNRAWKDTQGYPFLVQLWIEEAGSGGRSAVMLKRFYDRTTRWMNEKQKSWLFLVIFLDRINRSTLRKTLDDPAESDDLFEWFIKDGSIRDTSGEEFRVREYVRSRIMDYLKITDPDFFDYMKDRTSSMGIVAA